MPHQFICNFALCPILPLSSVVQTMGIALSKRNNSFHHHQHPDQNPPPPPPPPPHHHHHHHHHHQQQLISSHSSSDPSLLPSSSSTPPPPPPNYVFAANAPYSHPPPPPQNPTYPPPPPPPYYQQQYSGGGYNSCGYGGPILQNRSNYHPGYYPNHNNGWVNNIRPNLVPHANLPPPPVFVDHQTAKKIRNDVNVHKDTIKIEVDEDNTDGHLVSFTLDAVVDGSITILYFAKEGVDCSFVPLYPDAHMSVRVPFQKGLGQKFHQPSGTGIDLGFFDSDDLSSPSPGEDVFPLVIVAEAYPPLQPSDEQFHQPRPISNAQITQAIIEKGNGDNFQAKVIKQILWLDRVRYELREIYGITKSEETSVNDNDQGKECVICMSEPKDTAVLPCRHMCMCSGCAKELRLQTNKCPICRQPIQELMEIRVSKDDQ